MKEPYNLGLNRIYQKTFHKPNPLMMDGKTYFIENFCKIQWNHKNSRNIIKNIGSKKINSFTFIILEINH